MSSTYDNTVFDFDLDFLNQPPTNNAEPDLQARCDRLRKSVIFFKKRVKVIDHYVTVAKAAKNEVAELRITETRLKNQCQQHHVEIGNFIEKVTRLENEIQTLETQERLKDERIAELENKIVAQQKIYAQYKVLIEENKLEPIRNDRKKVKPSITNNAKKTINEKEIEILRKENSKLLNLDKINEKLRKEVARIPNLEKEIENLRKKNILVSESEKLNDHSEITTIEQLEKEIANISKENAKNSNLIKEIENLHKENAKIPQLEKEMVNLRNENTKIPKLENLMVNLRKENTKIPKFEKEIENLRTENAKISKLEKEIENLQRENARIPKLMKEIENQHKESANLKDLEKENETLFRLNVQISNLQKDIEILRNKNTEIEIDNKTLRKHIVKIPNEKDIEPLNSITYENDKLGTKDNKLTRKYESLPDTQDERSNDDEVENDIFEDPLPSPIPNDSFDKKSLMADEDLTEAHESGTDNTPEYLTNGGNKDIITDTAISRSPTKGIEIPAITIVDHTGNQMNCERSGSRRSSNSKLLSTVTDDVEIRLNTRTQEKEYLEINNSLQCESHTDLELENIFSTMKLHYEIISPIPKTPTVPDVASTSSSSELHEKFDRCSSLCYKTVDFMQLIIKMAITQGRDRNKVNINDCDKMIACFESILKSEQILTETNPEYNSNSNMETSDCVLVRDGNNISTASNPLQKETETLQNKKCEERLSQNTFLLQEENQNPSLNKGTNIMINKQVETEIPLLMHENHEQITNHSVSEEFATDNEIFKVIDSDGSVHDVVEVTPPPIIKRKSKNKKKTKLEKLKKKLEPKYKIKMEKTISENLRKPKQLLSIKRKVTENDTSASLNPKEVYEKAVKFMAQINSQQSVTQAKTPSKQIKDAQKPRRHTACFEKHIESSADNQILDSVKTRSKRKFSELFDSCTVVLAKDPLLLSPRKSENSKIHKAKENNDCATQMAKEDKKSTTHQEKDVNCSIIHEKEENNSIRDKAKDIKKSTTDKIKENNEPLNELPSRKRRRRSSVELPNNSSINAKEEIISITHKAKEDNVITTNEGKEDNVSTIHNVKVSTTNKEHEDNVSTTHKGKEGNFSTTDKVKEDNVSIPDKIKENNVTTTQKVKGDIEPSDELPLRKRCRLSTNEHVVQYKRVLRSATVHTKLGTEDNIELSKSKVESRDPIMGPSESENSTQINNESFLHNNVVSYEDLNVFSEDIQLEKKTSTPVKEADTDASNCHPKDSVLCYMIEKHGVETVRLYEKKIPDNIVKQICEKLERDIAGITQTHDSKTAMINFVVELRKLNHKHFIAGLIQFLSKSERKLELFGKVKSNPAPAMTKTEQILLYVIGQLRNHWPSVDIVDAVLSSIEFHLFKLNRTPEFDVIESTSHFYALLCRYVRAKSRLRLFILDAMYCMQFKSVPLIKQCLEVWMNIIPLSHLGMAKSPIVTCLVYLLHFYKCDDKFNRVQEIRKILRDEYFYKITDWNETKILEMFKNAIKDLKDVSIEKKMLRLALIILAKRQGPQWCQNHIVKNILQPMIEKRNAPKNVKEFCVSVMGPLMKPYPVDMKVHCEIAINQLKDILDNNPSPEMEEAAITSMMYINRHDQRSINKILLSRKMKPMSLALEKSIRDYVKAKSLKVWKKHLSALAR